MINNKKILAVVLARKNSKGLPGKNIKNLNGKPLVAWPISTAKKSKYIDKIILSTDCKEIASIGETYGAIIPFIRPDNLSEDNSRSEDALIHAIDFLDLEREHYDYVVLLEPTSPLTEAFDIDRALEQLINNTFSYTALVSIGEVTASHPLFCFSLDQNMAIKPYSSEQNEITIPRRQDINPLFFCDGSLYISSIKEFIIKKTFYHSNTMGFVMPEWKNLEIDRELDLFLVEQIMREYQKDKYEEK